MATFEKMIGLDAEVKMSAMKTIAGLVFEIDGDGINIEIGLIEVLFQLNVIMSEIESFETIVDYLVYDLVIFVLKDK